jgi:histidine triad (HIT) family protein
MENCIFCKITKGEIPTHGKLYEDDKSLAFLSTGPNNLGHALVIPKEHAANIYDISEESLTAVAHTTQKVATALKKSLAADGINIMQNNDKAAGQAVFHLHFHVIPRYFNDGFRHWEEHKKYKEGEVDEYAEKIKKEIK